MERGRANIRDFKITTSPIPKRKSRRDVKYIYKSGYDLHSQYLKNAFLYFDPTKIGQLLLKSD